MPARVSPLMFPARGLHSRLYALRVGTAVGETTSPSARISREPEAAVAACIMPPSDPGADETQTPYACHPTTASPIRDRLGGQAVRAEIRPVCYCSRSLQAWLRGASGPARDFRPLRVARHRRRPPPDTPGLAIPSDGRTRGSPRPGGQAPRPPEPG